MKISARSSKYEKDALKRKIESIFNAVKNGDNVCLPYELKLFIPVYRGGEVDLKRKPPQVLETKDSEPPKKLIREVVKVFGGATVYDDAVGVYSYIDEKCMIEKNDVEACTKEEWEPVWVLEANHKCVDPRKIQKIIDAIAEYGVKHKQMALGIKVNGELFVLNTDEFVKTRYIDRMRPKWREPKTFKRLQL